jgi:hypothetical protein
MGEDERRVRPAAVAPSSRNSSARIGVCFIPILWTDLRSQQKPSVQAVRRSLIHTALKRLENRPNTATRSSRRFAIVTRVPAQTGPDPSQAPRTQVGAYPFGQFSLGRGTAIIPLAWWIDPHKQPSTWPQCAPAVGAFCWSMPASMLCYPSSVGLGRPVWDAKVKAQRLKALTARFEEAPAMRCPGATGQSRRSAFRNDRRLC